MLGTNSFRFLLLWGLLLGTGLAQAASKPIDLERSTLTVRVLTGGLFAAFGHEHEIRAPIEAGSFDEQVPAAELAVDARKLRVMDKEVSDKDRAQIQETMLGPKVLDSETFPEIRFRSTGIEGKETGKWTVRGDLTVHGVTHPVSVQVEGREGHYHGSAEIRQKDFGIAPINVAGGAVKTKNELRVEFEIWAK